MKELSIEEKARNYDEAYKKVAIRFGSNVADEIFSQFEMSEDERIRKALINVFATHKDYEMFFGVSVEDILAWLEKQGEQKPNPCDGCINRKGCINCENGELRETEQKSLDKVEPKFHQGEWITNGDYTWKIIEVKPLDYILQSQDGNTVDDTISHVDEQFHSFTIEDAKDGDVLVSRVKQPFIFKSYDEDTAYVYAHCGICDLVKDNDNSFYNDNGYDEPWTCYHDNGDIYPATKEQRALLFSKIKEAGYEWNAEKKELKKIEQKPTDKLDLKKIERNDCKTCGFRTLAYKQNPAWSEEDEKMIKVVIESCEQCGNEYAYYWLKSLKDRCLPQPKQEWSKEDEKAINDIMWIIEAYRENGFNESHKQMANNAETWLKSLRPQNWTKKDKERYISCFQRLSTGNPEQPETINSKWFKEHVYPQSQWKPSDEQMWALSTLANIPESASDTCKKTAQELLEQLKKLREE